MNAIKKSCSALLAASALAANLTGALCAQTAAGPAGRIYTRAIPIGKPGAEASVMGLDDSGSRAVLLRRSRRDAWAGISILDRSESGWTEKLVLERKGQGDQNSGLTLKPVALSRDGRFLLYVVTPLRNVWDSEKLMALDAASGESTLVGERKPDFTVSLLYDAGRVRQIASDSDWMKTTYRWKSYDEAFSDSGQRRCQSHFNPRLGFYQGAMTLVAGGYSQAFDPRALSRARVSEWQVETYYAADCSRGVMSLAGLVGDDWTEFQLAEFGVKP